MLVLPIQETRHFTTGSITTDTKQRKKMTENKRRSFLKHNKDRQNHPVGIPIKTTDNCDRSAEMFDHIVKSAEMDAT